MIPVMKFHSLWRFNILEVISNYESFLKRFSTRILKDQKATDKILNKKTRKKKLYIPPLTEEKLKVLNDITSITVEMNHVSWAKISTLNFSVLEWNAFELPKDFRNNMNEFEILNLGNVVKQEIPSSDLYVIENHNNYRIKFNDLYLKISLMVHIGNFSTDLEIFDRIVFQHPMIMNNTYKLLVGRERRTTKHIVENIFMLQKDQSSSNDNALNISSSIKVSDDKIQNFVNCNRTKQESLSLALLTGLSFLHLNFFEKHENFTNKNIQHSC